MSARAAARKTARSKKRSEKQRVAPSEKPMTDDPSDDEPRCVWCRSACPSLINSSCCTYECLLQQGFSTGNRNSYNRDYSMVMSQRQYYGRDEEVERNETARAPGESDQHYWQRALAKIYQGAGKTRLKLLLHQQLERNGVFRGEAQRSRENKPADAKRTKAGNKVHRVQ